MYRLTIFWALIAAGALVFFAGCALNVSFWLTGRFGPDPQQSKAAKLWALVRLALRRISGPGLGPLLRSLVADGLLHRSLFREDKLRWLAHTSLSVGFLLLFALSAFTGFFEEILHQAFGVSTPFVMAVVNKDTPVMAFLNETLGLIIVFGLALIVVRRYIVRPVQMRTAAQDHWIIALLGIGLLTAYPTEAFRLLMENTPPSVGWYSYLGYAVAQALRPLALSWAQWHFAMFMAHIAPFIALLIYMPFSKFWHVLVSPIVATVNALRREASR